MSLATKQFIKICLILVVGIFLFSVDKNSVASAATYYVDKVSGDDSTGDGSSGSPYKTFHKAYITASAGDTLDLTGTFTWTDVGETASSTNGYNITKNNLTIVGHGADQTIIQSSSTEAIASYRVFTVGANVSTTFSNLTIRYGRTASHGGCVYTGGGTNSTFNNVEIYGCRVNGNYSGGGIYNASTTTISNSAIYNNISTYDGGGINSSGGFLYITNSTIYNNQVTNSSYGGGGVYLGSGTGYLTNCTVSGNYSTYSWGSPGVYVYGASTKIYLRNNIMVGNSGNNKPNFYRFSGTVYNNGYNIWAGDTGSSLTATTGDWSDTNSDGVYDLYSIATTGTLSMDTGLSINDSSIKTRTLAFTSSTSIAKNNATTTANNSVIDIPTSDQRGATRNGNTDIGAFEFDGGGLSVSLPDTQLSNFVTTTAVTYKSMSVGWANGNGARHVIFMKAADSGTASPVDGTQYTASSTFGSGSQIGSSGWYAVYDGPAATSTSITNLAASTNYIFQGFEYNGVGTGQSVYNTSTASNNPRVISTYLVRTLYANSATIEATSTQDGTADHPFKTFHQAYSSSTAGDTLDLTGTFTWTDAAESGDAATNGYTIGRDLFIVGHGAYQTIMQSASTDNTADRRVFTVSTGVSTTFQNLAIRYGKLTSASGGGLYAGDVSINVTLNNVDLYNNRVTNSSYYAGGIFSYANLNINNSAIYNNVAAGCAGGFYLSGSSVRSITKITNSSIFSNQSLLSNGLGGSFYVDGLTGLYLTNVTMTGNTGAFGANITQYSANSQIYFKNSIFANNVSTLNASYNNYYMDFSGSVVSNGYNILGKGTYGAAFASTTGDWVDTAGTGVFRLYGASTTGTVNFDTEAGINDNPNFTRTWGVLSGSVAINNGTASAHGTISIPSTDQRGATRSGATDIGAFEYGGEGLSIAAPSSQASGIATTTVPTFNSISISWIGGSGSRRAVFMAATSTGSAEPVNGTQYSGNASFGSGSQIGSSGWYSVYDGTSTSTLTITNLSSSANYTIQIFEYNGVLGGQMIYNTSTVGSNSLVVATYAPATRYINASTGNDNTGDGTSGNPWKTFHKGYSSSTAGDTLDLTGTFDWSSADETGDAATTGYTIGKILTISGHGPDQTIVQAASADNIAARRVFTVSTGVSTTFQNLAIRYGKVTGGSDDGGGIKTSGPINIINSEIYNNRSSDWGGGVYIGTTATATIYNSAIYSNYVYYGGGGVSYWSGTSGVGMLVITNSTIASNQRSASSGNTEGAGVNVWGGNSILTNTTISKNIAVTGSGGNCGFSMQDPLSTTTLRNTIIAGNTGSTLEYGYRSAGQGNTVDNGYNIIAGSQAYYTWRSTSTDWTDANQTGVFTLYGTATTGTISLDTDVSINDNTIYKTKTVALTASTSIAINNATTTANGVITIPTTDQRGGARSGATDIGAYEYNAGGITFATPTVQVYNITSSSVTYKSMIVSWVNGNGARRTVFAKQGSSGTATPVDGARYTASSTFGVGNQIGSSGWYAIYDGLNTSSTVTNLLAATDYIFQVFEYNGVNENQSVYYVATSTNNPVVIQTYTPVTRYINYSTGNDTSGNGTSGSPWKTFHKGYTSSTAGDTLDLTGTFTWSNSDETGDAATTGYTISKDLTISGHGADQTIFQPTSTENVASMRVFTVSTGVSTTFNNLTIRYGKVGGSYDGGGISSLGPLTIINSEIYGNRATGGWGAGVYGNGATTTITGCAIYSNITYYGGGGVAFFGPSSGSRIPLIITNSTIASNQRTATSGNMEAAGATIWNADAILTNVTISRNSAPNGSGSTGFSMQDPLGYTTLSNTIIAGNIGSTLEYAYRSAGQGNTVDNGYNIIAGSQAYYTWRSTSTDWTDVSQTGVFTKYGTSVTGTLGIDTTSSLNYSLYNTKTLAVTSSASIAINSGTSTSNGIVSIPTTDQRGANRSGEVDVGAYEYGGTFEGTNHTLTYVAGANGSISGSSSQSVIHAGSGTAVTAVADSGYRFVSWSDGSTSNPRTDTGVTTTISVSASFAIDSYTLTYTAGTGGTLTGSSTQVIAPGGNGTEVIAVPNTGYIFSSWSDGVLTTARTETNVSTSTSVTANFIITTNTISYIAGSGGTISGSATQVVNYASSTTAVTAVPDTGYSFTNWSDGGLTATRTDTNITTSASYTASFLINSYTLTYSAGAGGSLTGSSTQVLNYGESGTAITPVPNTGYHFVNWSDASSANPRTDTNVAGNVTVTANFAIDTFIVTYTAGAGGTLTGSSTQVVNYGSSTVAITAVSSTGYDFVNWSDGSLSNPRYDSNVTGTISVIANFTTNTYTLLYTAGSGGTISGSSNQSVQHGSNGSSVTAVPATGYTFVSWSDGITSTSRSESNVTSSRSLIASFLINTYTLNYTAGSNGSLTGSSTQSVQYNNSGTAVVPVPDTGYRFVDWSDSSTANPRVDNNVSDNISVSANFALLNAPAFSNVASAPTADAVTITWTTDINASTKVIYGANTNYGNATAESDTVSRLTSHSVSLSGLTSCATYYYKVISANVNELYATSTGYSFITTGCTASSAITTSTSETASVVATTTVSLLDSSVGVTLEISAGYATSTADFQIKKLVQDTVVAVVGAPSGYVEAGDYVYSFKAITEDLETITNFNSDITITLSYSDSDVTGVVETSLQIFYWDGLVWSALTNCVVDTAGNSVTCDTNHFSTFGLFGLAQQNNSSGGGVAFVPPAPPLILSQPRAGSSGKILSDVSNGYQIAVSDNSNFKNSSWELYKKEYVYNGKAEFVYVKFRTALGGESGVYKIAVRQNTVLEKKTTSTVSKYKFIRDLKLGAIGVDVKELQKWLNSNGYTIAKTGAGSPGKETTKFGAATRATLIKFQKANKITPASGYFGPATRKMVNK